MPENGKRHDARARLKDWIENGSQPLDEEMQESLREDPLIPEEKTEARTGNVPSYAA